LTSSSSASRVGAGLAKNATPSPRLTYTPSSTTTWKCVCKFRLEPNRWTKVTAPVCASVYPALFAQLRARRPRQVPGAPRGDRLRRASAPRKEGPRRAVGRGAGLAVHHLTQQRRRCGDGGQRIEKRRQRMVSRPSNAARGGVSMLSRASEGGSRGRFDALEVIEWVGARAFRCSRGHRMGGRGGKPSASIAAAVARGSGLHCSTLLDHRRDDVRCLAPSS
jgi:hypothetical protein